MGRNYNSPLPTGADKIPVKLRHASAFTLIELLVVIAIVAVLALIVLVVINPAELLKQTRDSNRLSDMATIRSAIQTYQADIPAGTLGTSTITYLSLIDLSATTTLGTDCTALGFPSATYHCTASSSARNVDGTGWLPINFQSLSSKSPLSSLPIDPINTTSSNLYYAYVTDGLTWKVLSFPESQKYQAQITGTASSFQSGTNLFLLVPTPGLVGWWKFDEGAGSTVADFSGSSAVGTWNGSGVHWATGKVGNSAGQFSTTTVDYVAAPNPGGVFDFGTGDFTLMAWINPTDLASTYEVIIDKGGWGNPGFSLDISSLNRPDCSIQGAAGTNQHFNFGTASTNTWQHVACVFSRSDKVYGYINGSFISSSGYSVGNGGSVNNGYPLKIGYYTSTYYFPGLIDDVRVYNRALSAAEIWRIYTGTE